MRRALSTAIHFAAGFLYYGASLIAFVAFIPFTPKLITLACLALVATGLLWVGLVVSRTQNPRTEAGVVLTISAVVSLMIVLSLFLMSNFSPPPVREMFAERDLPKNFGDWPTGGLYLLALCVAPVWLLRSTTNESTEELSNPDQV